MRDRAREYRNRWGWAVGGDIWASRVYKLIYVVNIYGLNSEHNTVMTKDMRAHSNRNRFTFLGYSLAIARRNVQFTQERKRERVIYIIFFETKSINIVSGI